MSSSTTDNFLRSTLRRLLCIVFAIIASVSPERSAAQGCCSVSASSLRGLEGGTASIGILTIGANYQFNSLTHAYDERKRIDDPLRRTASVSYFTLFAEYGLASRVSVLATLGFSDKSREITVRNSITGFNETSTFAAAGINDALLFVKYQLVPVSITSPFGMAIGAGASLPTGSYTKERNGVQLSIDLQPGTGAPALIGWLHATRFFPYAGIEVMGAVTYKYSAANLDGYRIGDEYVVVLGGEYRLDEHFGFLVQLRSRFALQDFANRRVLTSTGGTYHDVLPSVTYRDGGSFVRVFSQLPVYRNVRGIQLSLTYLLGVEYSHSLNLFGSSAVPTAE